MTAFRSNEHWSVTIERNGDNIVTIGSNLLSGRDLNTDDECAIRTAAEHLLAFVGPRRVERCQEGWHRGIQLDGRWWRCTTCGDEWEFPIVSGPLGGR